jgi:hypothetical protein
MNKFESNIKMFLTKNQFDNNFDDFGNIDLNSNPANVNEKYMKIKISNYEYDDEKIKNLYDTEFKSFNVTTKQTVGQSFEDLKTSYDAAVTKNSELQKNLSDLLSTSESNDANADIQAQKDLIINLRIQLGQGKIAADFGDDFPYEPQ